LTSYKSKIINKGLLANFHLDPESLDTIKNDDVALLELGHRWVKQILFGTNGVQRSRFKIQSSDRNQSNQFNQLNHSNRFHPLADSI